MIVIFQQQKIYLKGVYYAFNIIHISVSMIASVVSAKLLHQKKIPHIANWLKIIFLLNKTKQKKIRKYSANHIYYQLSESNESNSSEWLLIKDKQSLATHQILDLLETRFKSLFTQRLHMRRMSKKNLEWKQFITRLEFIFRVISIVTLLSAPLVIFGKYFIRDKFFNHIKKNQCAC